MTYATEEVTETYSVGSSTFPTREEAAAYLLRQQKIRRIVRKLQGEDTSEGRAGLPSFSAMSDGTRLAKALAEILVDRPADVAFCLQAAAASSGEELDAALPPPSDEVEASTPTSRIPSVRQRPRTFT